MVVAGSVVATGGAVVVVVDSVGGGGVGAVVASAVRRTGEGDGGRADQDDDSAHDRATHGRGAVVWPWGARHVFTVERGARGTRRTGVAGHQRPTAPTDHQGRLEEVPTAEACLGSLSRHFATAAGGRGGRHRLMQNVGVSEIAEAVVVGLDVGGTKTNATVLAEDGTFLVDHMVEVMSCVLEGPAAAIAAIDKAMELVLARTATPRSRVRAIGLDTPGPASADGVISARGATNFAAAEWRGFDFRSAVEERLRLPVIYNNDGNAAALYAHERHFWDESSKRSSVAAIVGTGLGGGVVEAGRVIRGAAGMAGELGHIQIPMDGLLVPGQPVPRCNCGFTGDLESVASLSGIANNLLPFWLTRYPDHPLADVAIDIAAKQVRDYGERGDELAQHIFDQQAIAIGRMFTIAANFIDPDAYFIGGGVTDTGAEFRTRFMERVREATQLREEQAKVATFAIVPDLDKAGARGSALAALRAIRP